MCYLQPSSGLSRAQVLYKLYCGHAHREELHLLVCYAQPCGENVHTILILCIWLHYLFRWPSKCWDYSGGNLSSQKANWLQDWPQTGYSEKKKNMRKFQHLKGVSCVPEAHPRRTINL